MLAISYSDLRNNLAKTIDRVNEDHLPILITRQNGKPAVLMSLEDFNAYDETAYLMASPANKKDLEEAITEIKAGNVVYHELIEDDE
ncbi:type II toxin-antitoxin system prevent-host-death family antitoxin [Methyloglobulus sp.]|uniref:type II toxin-antitoxin system Phd/YefM family antitoxin n=1 Tax=Methyloglobulus sp. TaxID=2518622 RepID=UPI0032B832F4